MKKIIKILFLFILIFPVIGEVTQKQIDHFDFSKVDKILFYYSGNSVRNIKLIKDKKQIKDLLSSLEFKRKMPCGCMHFDIIEFYSGEEKLRIDFCDHCLGNFKMPKKFYEIYQSIDETRLVEAWIEERMFGKKVQINGGNKFKIPKDEVNCAPDILIKEMICDSTGKILFINDKLHSNFYYDADRYACEPKMNGIENLIFTGMVTFNGKGNTLYKVNLLFVKQDNFYILQPF